MEKTKILIVDDHRVVIEGIRSALQEHPEFEVVDEAVDGLEAVEKITGVAMTAHTTLREFLTTATPRLPAAARSFSELTSIAEVALYSTHKLEEDMATRAEKLAAATREELHGETA